MSTGTLPYLKFATRYAVVIFALGFILGVIRTMLLAPRIGALAAVCLEVPVMLLASWFYCRHLRHKLALAATWLPLLLWGTVAFAMLMLLEFSISILVFRQTPAAFAATLQTLPGLIGLLAQIAFALIPALQGLMPQLSGAQSAT